VRPKFEKVPRKVMTIEDFVKVAAAIVGLAIAVAFWVAVFHFVVKFW